MSLEDICKKVYGDVNKENMEASRNLVCKYINSSLPYKNVLGGKKR